MHETIVGHLPRLDVLLGRFASEIHPRSLTEPTLREPIGAFESIENARDFFPRGRQILSHLGQLLQKDFVTPP